MKMFREKHPWLSGRKVILFRKKGDSNVIGFTSDSYVIPLDDSTYWGWYHSKMNVLDQYAFKFMINKKGTIFYSTNSVDESTVFTDRNFALGLN
jgi:hypothetical protein